MPKDRKVNGAHAFVVSHDLPIVGIIVEENGKELTYYSSINQTADLAAAARQARALAGAWADLDWREAIEELDRIRHESVPTPPIEDV